MREIICGQRKLFYDKKGMGSSLESPEEDASSLLYRHGNGNFQILTNLIAQEFLQFVVAGN